MDTKVGVAGLDTGRLARLDIGPCHRGVAGPDTGDLAEMGTGV